MTNLICWIYKYEFAGPGRGRPGQSGRSGQRQIREEALQEQVEEGHAQEGDNEMVADSEEGGEELQELGQEQTEERQEQEEDQERGAGDDVAEEEELQELEHDKEQGEEFEHEAALKAAGSEVEKMIKAVKIEDISNMRSVEDLKCQAATAISFATPSTLTFATTLTCCTPRLSTCSPWSPSPAWTQAR